QARLEAEAARLTEDFERDAAVRSEAEAELAAARAALAALPADDAEGAKAAQVAAETALKDARSQLAAAEAQADEAQAKLADIKARRRAAEEAASRQRQRQAQLTSEIERLQTEMTGLEDAAIHVLRVRQARNAEAEAEAALHDAERAVEQAETELVRLRTDEAEAEGPHDAASHAVKALEAEIAGLEKLLHRRDAGTSAPPVVERIRTREGYEKAVAAALGDDISASTDRTAALYWGGAEVAPLTLPAGAELLSDYAEAPGELAARLALCGLVDAADGPRLMVALEPGQRLVSREGHLWRWDGFTRTPEAPVSAAARLEQQARLDAARTELAARREELSAAAAQLETARNARLTCEESLRHVRQLTGPAQRTLSDARSKAAEESQAAERASLRRDSSTEALKRAEADFAAVTEALSFAEPTAAEEEAVLEAALATAREALAAARAAETEARGRLADLTRGQEQAAARRTAMEREIESWTARLASAEARIEQLTERRADVAAAAFSAKERPQALTEEIDGLSRELEALEEARKAAADALAVKDTAIREAEAAARRAFAAASQAREALAGWSVKLETSEARLAESVEIARHNFQRTPEGLLAIAEAHLDAESLGAFTPREADARLDTLRRERDQLGGVNMNAEEEAAELEDRLGVQIAERDDLVAAIAKLRQGVEALNVEGRERLVAAFETVNEHFKALFEALFGGGQAELRLVDADDPLKAGLEIFAQPPGKKLGTLNLMSGGEQALTATALIFAVFLSRPAPICVLDEVDAPLDDANVDRFCNMLNEMRQRTETRFVVITHNAVTMSRMDRLFGVTMREKGVSKLVSVDLAGAEQLVAAE
ncbi:MAG: chromosome segregation protein SMC, partial [Hyphomonas sp.]